MRKCIIICICLSYTITLYARSANFTLTDTPRTKSYWEGKKIVWFGTSIPEQGYPQLIGKMLNAHVINEAVGSSGARRGRLETSKEDPFGWNGLAWENVVRSLSQTLAEKEELIANWAFWKTKFKPSNTIPDTLSTALKKSIREWSWETKLNRHLGKGNRADLYVFDHGHNDNFSYLPTYLDMDIIPSNTRDRNYYIGAMNFLIDKILADNPRARICFIGHYENQKKPIIAKGQQVLAQFWNYPLLELWSKLGWSQQKIKTTGFWKDKFTWVPEGGAVTEKTMTQIWMFDDLHPASAETKELLAKTIASWLNEVR